MMLGTRDEFKYFLCNTCGCLQITSIPGNLGSYYPDNYYSLQKMNRFVNAPVRKWVDNLRVADTLGEFSLAGKIFNAISRPLEYMSWVKNAGINRDSRILDVGCGQGRLLLRMSLGGFRNLTGLDPYVADNINYDNNVTINKADLSEFSASGQKFDFIMLHHSLEHMPDQHEALGAITKLLAQDGVLLVRIPLSDSYAWDNYRENWVQLDAPRHLYLHSKKSFQKLADDSGLAIEKIIYDSSKFQFTGSELYKKDIPLISSKKTRDIFSKDQLRQYTIESEKLNSKQLGDQAEFYLRAC